eukprot:scaffold75355_cov57-Phaeocystis_antarctica.AAC.3
MEVGDLPAIISRHSELSSQSMTGQTMPSRASLEVEGGRREIEGDRGPKRDAEVLVQLLVGEVDEELLERYTQVRVWLGCALGDTH